MPETKSNKFGAFTGVFVPNVLTILGVIMFLRTGWIVGNLGLWQSLLVLLLANCITALTALSLSAIATNEKVGPGGAYFLISRSLGLEIGGSIGIPLFLAQAISVAFYLVGFSESLAFFYPNISVQWVSAAALVVFSILAFWSTSFVIKAQLGILGLLCLSLLSFFLNVPEFAAGALVSGSELEPGYSFWPLFAIFFPAVTGIMSGLSLSGDLKNPSRDIPLGTNWAVFVTGVIYAVQIIWFAFGATRDQLLGNRLVMADYALSSELILIGLWAASLSSALATLAAAPRTLYALSRDGIVPRFFSITAGRNAEPRNALLATIVIAAACIAAGGIDFIAPLITMFFLMTYGTLNLVAGTESLIANPSFRPAFKVKWYLSILGSFACFAAMLLINLPATIGAAAFFAILHFKFQRASLKTSWGDIRSGLWFSIARASFRRFASTQQHIRNWRPMLLVLVGNPKTRMHLAQFAQDLEAGRGFLFLAHILTGVQDELAERQRNARDSLQRFIAEQGMTGAGKAMVARSFNEGVSVLVHLAGLGVLQPNTVLMGWSRDGFKRDLFVSTVNTVISNKKNLLLYRVAEAQQRGRKTIDVWWYSKTNGSFMLTLAFLLQTSPRYRGHKLRVLRVIRDSTAISATKEGILDFTEQLRIKTEVEVVVSSLAPLDVLAEQSLDSEVVFVGMALPQANAEEEPLENFREMLDKLRGNVVIAKNWEDLRT